MLCYPTNAEPQTLSYPLSINNDQNSTQIKKKQQQKQEQQKQP